MGCSTAWRGTCARWSWQAAVECVPPRSAGGWVRRGAMHRRFAISMSLGEFELIQRYFAHSGAVRGDVAAGIGDDAAVLRVAEGRELVAATDTLVAGVHFPADTAPEAVGHKSLAVNLSDLAAMGAEPAWVLLALTLPEADEAWLAGFARGFLSLAGRQRVPLVGGDTTRGPLSVTVQALGTVPKGGAVRRAGARPGDGLFVTGTLGDAALALEVLQGTRRIAGDSALAALRGRLDRPEPRVAAGLALRPAASAMIDVSDGLLADVGHLAEAGAVAITVWPEALPRSAEYRSAAPDTEDWGPALSGGDDYELCFTLPPGREGVLATLDCGATRIGVVETGAGVRCLRRDGSELPIARTGYTHFPRTDP